VRNVRKIIVLVLICLFASTTLALAAWKVVDLAKGGDNGAANGKAISTQPGEADTRPGEPGADEGAGQGGVTASGEVDAALVTGEDLSYTDPDQRYVSETQRHQNFFIALAEGRVKRLDAIATDYQPAGDPNSSYLYFTITTTDGGKHDGTMVLKQDAGLWRIAAIRQLEGDLGGGTNYPVPASFEDDLAREIQELQEFLTKVAQGRLDYMVVDSVSRPSDTETILVGRVVGVGGRIQQSEMRLHNDYNIWHLTNIRAL